MAGLAGTLARAGHTILPTHPGFDGRPRPDWCARTADLALADLALLDRIGVDDVIVVGNSAGGWIAAEMGPRAPARPRPAHVRGLGRERPHHHARVRRHFAELIPAARFEAVPEAGHFPQIEQPDAVTAAIDGLLHRPGASVIP